MLGKWKKISGAEYGRRWDHGGRQIQIMNDLVDNGQQFICLLFERDGKPVEGLEQRSSLI